MRCSDEENEKLTQELIIQKEHFETTVNQLQDENTKLNNEVSRQKDRLKGIISRLEVALLKLSDVEDAINSIFEG